MHSRVNLTLYFTISDSPGDASCAAHRSVTPKRGIVHPRFWLTDWAVLAQTGACAVQWLWRWATVAGLPLGLVVHGRPLLRRWPVGSPSHSLARGHLKHNVFDPPFKRDQLLQVTFVLELVAERNNRKEQQISLGPESLGARVPESWQPMHSIENDECDRPRPTAASPSPGQSALIKLPTLRVTTTTKPKRDSCSVAATTEVCLPRSLRDHAFQFISESCPRSLRSWHSRRTDTQARPVPMKELVFT